MNTQLLVNDHDFFVTKVQDGWSGNARRPFREGDKDILAISFFRGAK